MVIIAQQVTWNCSPRKRPRPPGGHVPSQEAYEDEAALAAEDAYEAQ